MPLIIHLRRLISFEDCLADTPIKNITAKIKLYAYIKNLQEMLNSMFVLSSIHKALFPTILL